MRGRTQAPGQQELLFLPLAPFAQVPVKVLPAHIHVPKNRLEQRFIQPVSADEVPHAAAKVLRLLRHIGDDQPGGDVYLSLQRTARAAQRLEHAALARPVGTGERHAVAPVDVKADSLAYRAAIIAHRAVLYAHQRLLGMP